MTDSAQFRFVAVAVGLVIVVALVYLRFIRSSKDELTPPDVTAGAGPAPQ